MRPPSESAGSIIVQANLIGTVLFALSALTAAVTFGSTARAVAAAVALVLFFTGIVAFAWSFWNAVQRSREEQIGVMQMYLLLGPPTPARVRSIMLSMLATQVIVALVTALARSESEDGSPGTSLAVGILVPMFGLGLNGLWCAFHGVFPPRPDIEVQAVDDGVVASRAPIDKNDDHG